MPRSGHLVALVRPLWAVLLLLALFGAARVSPDPAAPVSATADADPGAVTPTTRLDPMRMVYARLSYRRLCFLQARRRAARTVGEARRWQGWAQSAWADYGFEYRAVTPAGRRRSHLVPPEALAP